jgi:hypothetical protein
MAMRSSTGRFVGILPDGERVTGAQVILVKYGLVLAMDMWCIHNFRTARRNGQVIVHDLDDWEPMLDKPGGTGIMQRAGWTAVHSAAGALFVATPYLAERFGKVITKTPVVLIPTALDLTAWDGVEPEIVSDGPVLGWTGVPGLRRQDLALFRGWLGPFMEEHDLTLIHAGRQHYPWAHWNLDVAPAAGIDPERVAVRDMVPAADFPSSGNLDGVDVGVVPMADTNVSRGRAPGKAFDFVARGIPFVFSPSDNYKALGVGRMAGTSLADQPPSAWLEELERLLDPAERVTAVKEDAEALRSWDIRDRWTDWESALTKVVERRHRDSRHSLGSY